MGSKGKMTRVMGSRIMDFGGVDVEGELIELSHRLNVMLNRECGLEVSVEKNELEDIMDDLNMLVREVFYTN